MDPFIGEIRLVGFSFAPPGWALCDGQDIAIAQNTALFSLLGTTYGGDGKQTFKLPKLPHTHSSTSSGTHIIALQGLYPARN